MTELERILKNTLLTLERDLTATQTRQGNSLNSHQRNLESHAQAISQLQANIWPTPERTSRISTALATLERYTRELGIALVALERLVERQIERLREREREHERQRSRGPGMGR